MTTLGAASGAVAGLVAITPACGFVNALRRHRHRRASPAPLCAFAVTLKHRLGYDDALDVVGVHLVGGLVGTLMIGIVGDQTHTLTESAARRRQPRPARHAGRRGLRGPRVLLRRHARASRCIIKAVMGLRVPEEEEVIGIDQTTHAETAYELGGGIGGGGGHGGIPGAAARPSSVEVTS